MFELNKVQRTKSGELLKPFTVQGEMVLCADRDGNTVKVPLSEFDFSTPVEKEVITVQAIKGEKREVNRQEVVSVVEENKNEDSLFTEDKIEEDLFTPEPEPEPEPEEEPEEPKPTKPSSIWDTLGDDYL